MTWVVKTWRVEEELRAAERETRRLGRIAARERADADAHLDLLEAFGVEMLEGVRQRRGAPANAGRADPVVVPEPLTVRASRNPRRASLRDSPLTELFRPTAPR